MNRRKGITALFLIGVFTFVFIFFNLVVYFFISIFAAQTENLFFISIEDNERGKELRSFLSSKNGDAYYMEKIGNVVAKGGDLEFDELGDTLLNTLKYMDKGCLVVFSGGDIDNPIKKLGTCPQDAGDNQGAQLADIPIPGARTSNTRIQVKIQ
jgi:hypothetical protein